MPVYVLYAGRLIEKRYRPAPAASHAASELPAPAVQSFESYLSPIDDAPVTSHRQRERDLHRSGSYDRRDTPVAFRKARDVRYQQQRRRPVAAEP
jgi:hypothetical protein